jgi:import inner membrane translocase subunit TIM16
MDPSDINAGGGALGSGGGAGGAATGADPISRQTRLTLDESMLILNLRKELQGQKDELVNEAIKNYEHMMQANEKTSLYIQSKIVRARERIALE